MNDLAREALVAAALKGVRQIKGYFRDSHGGRCAMGVLNDAAGISDWSINADSCERDLQKNFGMTLEEAREVVTANDDKEWDFLTIARKIGNAEESV